MTRVYMHWFERYCTDVNLFLLFRLPVSSSNPFAAATGEKSAMRPFAKLLRTLFLVYSHPAVHITEPFSLIRIK